MLGSKELKGEIELSNVVDFKNATTAGLESSPVAEALAGLRAHEARYFMNKYKYEFTVVPASESKENLDYVNRILKEERNIEFAAKPIETSCFQVENIKFTYVFYEDGLAVNVMYTLDNPKKRAVGFKLSDGMEVPTELAEKFKFARQKSKLAGTIRGSFFVIKGEYSVS
ncbi:phage tail protein [Bacillus paramycoides]|uniref:phage tail protein n=1 Tax=Bacillus paramycoides TaxID=2026194 RepID=UPI0015BAFAC2|nr:phage tail protein [Bacillus paramycoides]NWK69069.1 phage tail protein [Bacillus paramycoides]